MDNNEALFCEHNVAAQSLKNNWTRLASTYGCMEVMLSPTSLIIKPHWFAKWMIILLRLDLCHTLPVSRVLTVSEEGNSSGYGKVELRFRAMDGSERTLWLYLKKRQEFVEKIKNVMHRYKEL